MTTRSIDGCPRESQRHLSVVEVVTARELLLCLRIRLLVFVHEQRVPVSEEVDVWDASAIHFLARLNGKAVGTARLVQLDDGTAKIGRVAVLKPYRQQGVGSALMTAVIAHAKSMCHRLILDAQVTAQGFYQRWGFKTTGSEFMDAGIPHVRMVLGLTDTR